MRRRIKKEEKEEGIAFNVPHKNYKSMSKQAPETARASPRDGFSPAGLSDCLLIHRTSGGLFVVYKSKRVIVSGNEGAIVRVPRRSQESVRVDHVRIEGGVAQHGDIGETSPDRSM